MTGPPLELSVVGVSFGNRQEIIKKTAVGEPLLVVREPTNPVDPNAVAVLTIRGEQLGYVKKELTQHFLEDVTVGRVKVIGHADTSLPLALRIQCEPGHPSLTVDMLPPAFPCTNLSEHMEARAWNCLQRASFSVARYRCQICGEVGARWPVECHERWKVDDATKTITLQGLLALCPGCHSVKHMHSGATTSVGGHAVALKHLGRINEWSLEEVQAYVAYVKRTVEERSQTTDWKVDLEWIGSQGPAARQDAPASQEPSDAEKTLAGSSPTLMQTDDAGASVVGFPHITDVRWRVDVTLSNSSLKRVLQPSVLLQLTLTDGTVHTFEASKEQFALLRHAVARSLHEMEAVTPKVEKAKQLTKRVEHHAEVFKADSLNRKAGFAGGRGGG